MITKHNPFFVEVDQPTLLRLLEESFQTYVDLRRRPLLDLAAEPVDVDAEIAERQQLIEEVRRLPGPVVIAMYLPPSVASMLSRLPEYRQALLT